jgi:hypothetical protein
LSEAAVKSATQAWTACMAKNGYSFRQPQTVFFAEIRATYGGGPVAPDTTVSAAANQAQIAAAVTDANCTQSADLAGILFAVQANLLTAECSPSRPDPRFSTISTRTAISVPPAPSGPILRKHSR